MVECRGQVERALASLADRPGQDTRREMRLRTALLVSLMHTRGAALDTIAAWTTVLDIAKGLGDTDYQLAALWGLWLFRITRGEARTALVLVDRFCGLVTDPADRLRGERMMGASPRCTTSGTRRTRGRSSAATSPQPANRARSPFNMASRMPA